MSTTQTTTDTTATAAAIHKFEEDAKHGRLLLQDFHIIKKLGQGGEGVVFLVKHIESGFEIALKCVMADFGEAEIHRQVSSGGHPNILHMYGSFRNEENGDICLMLEYCPHGTVFDVIDNSFYKTDSKGIGKFKSEDEFVSKVATDILKALKHIKQNDVLHSDIKVTNVLWGKDGNAKLADFGLATKFTSSSSSSSSSPSSSNPSSRSKKLLGTISYMAPEVLALQRKLKLRKENQQHERFGYSHEADLWSLGVAIFVLAFGFRAPFPYEPNKSQSPADNLRMYMEQNKYFSSRCLQFPDDASDDLKNLILGLLQTNPDKRLTIDEALQHPWILRHTTESTQEHRHPLATTTANTKHHDQLVTGDLENTTAAVQDGKTPTSSDNGDESIKYDDDSNTTLEHALRGLDLNSP